MVIDPLRILKVLQRAATQRAGGASLVIDPLRILKVLRCIPTFQEPCCASLVIDPLRILKVTMGAVFLYASFGFIGYRSAEDTESL